MMLRWPLGISLAVIACGSGSNRAPSTTETVTTTTTTTVTTGTAPAASSSAPPSAQPSAPVYTADDAVRDALATPLTLVGIGGWYGHYRRLSCVYKNAQVMVVDARCEEPAAEQLSVIIESPSRGRVELGVEAKKPLGSAKRADYATFQVSGAGPWTGPTPLSLSMAYDEMAAYEDQRSPKSGGCSLTAKYPQGICSHGAAYTAPAFAAANTRFLEAPPDAWYALARAMIDARHASYAANDLGKVSAKQLGAWGGWIGFQRAIDIGDNALAFVGQRDRFAAVVATSDGGMALVGTRRGAQVVVARTDRRATIQWESALTEPGIREESDNTSLVATSDGFVVHASGWPSPGVKARHRLVKLDAHGHVQWRWVPPDRGPIAVPQFFRAGLTPQGTIVIDGYIQTEKDGPVRGWTAEVSAAGKTLRDDVGSVELGAKNSKP